MDDLERLFRGLIAAIRESGPARLRAPFQVSELYQSIIPYRGFKKQLGFDSSEDYDMAVLRLLAGERDYASVEPQEVREQLALEAEAISPTPGLYREFAAARVTLNVAAVQSLDSEAESYAPPDARAEAPPDSEDERFGPPVELPEGDSAGLVFEPVDAPPRAVEPTRQPTAARDHPPNAPTCPDCSQTLPPGRQLVFCPFCGVQIAVFPCRSCGSEVEPGWTYCAECGRAATDR
jgi:hypothetical protein